MSYDEKIAQEAKTVIMEIMMVLYKHGIHEVHMGGMLRLMGVSEEKARESDDEVIVLDDKFTEYLERMLTLAEVEVDNTTLH
jgi:hypothetical protein